MSRADSECREADGLCSLKLLPNIEFDASDGFVPAPGVRLRVEDSLLEIEKVGKDCYAECEAFRRAGPCALARGCLFALVIEGGVIRIGQEVRIV